MKYPDIAVRAEAITRDFVAVRSVNGEPGAEKDAADFLEKTLRAIPYFAAHPACVIRQELPGDALQRANIFAYLTGTKRESSRAIIWHGHMDTVGTADYGALEPLATKPDLLRRAMLAMDLPADMREELESGDWMPGRGACDMKSGGAVFIALLEYLSTRRETFAGTILLSLNPVEENEHLGMLEGLKVLQQLQREKGFEYAFAINNDYTCPFYAGDPHRYIYTGAVGKLLPCIYIQGCETHVGQCFEGFDASVAAAEIVRAVNYNPDFCDGYRGEYTLPPSVLKLQDLKEGYNVQTAKEAFLYFNDLIHAKSAGEVLEEFRQTAALCMKEVAKRIAEASRIYDGLAGQEGSPIPFRPQVMTYAQLVEAVRDQAGMHAVHEAESLAAALLAEERDRRECALAVVRQLVRDLGVQEPLAVVFFAAPYCPCNTLRQENAEEAQLYDQLEALIADFAEESGEDYVIRQFFPSLSDSSDLKIDDATAFLDADPERPNSVFSRDFGGCVREGYILGRFRGARGLRAAHGGARRAVHRRGERGSVRGRRFHVPQREDHRARHVRAHGSKGLRGGARRTRSLRL